MFGPKPQIFAFLCIALIFGKSCNFAGSKQKDNEMTTATSINVQMPRGDLSFLRQLAKRMGWTVSAAVQPDNLYDPETGEYLNEETMQAIRDVEAGHVKRCKDFDELLAAI